jgi:adenylate cyclase
MAQAQGPIVSAQLAVSFPDGTVRTIALHQRVVFGRECPGVPEAERVLVDDPAVSRHHLELRVDLIAGAVYAVDTSTNGTYLNGARLDRGAVVPLCAGDRLRFGKVDVEVFVAGGPGATPGARTTIRTVTHASMLHVVGDIVDYSSLAQFNDSATLTGAVDMLFGELRSLVTAHRGALANFAGDALYAVWDADAIGDACERALDFVGRASETVGRVSPKLAITTATGDPLRMGWGVTAGQASTTLLAGSLTTVLGDATNVAFRLSGLAGRLGNPEILVDDSVLRLAPDAFSFGDAELLAIKGREERVSALAFLGRRPA